MAAGVIPTNYELKPPGILLYKDSLLGVVNILDYKMPDPHNRGSFKKVTPLGVLDQEIAYRGWELIWPKEVQLIGTDNSEVINHAIQHIDYAATLYFPSCVIPIADTLMVDRPLTIKGDGIASCLYFLAGLPKRDPPARGIIVRPTPKQDSTLEGVRIQDIALIGPKKACSAVLEIRATNHSTFQNIFTNCGATNAVLFDYDTDHTKYSADSNGNYLNFLIGGIFCCPLVGPVGPYCASPDNGIVLEWSNNETGKRGGPNFAANRIHCYIEQLDGMAVCLDWGPDSVLPANTFLTRGKSTTISGLYQNNKFGISIKYGQFITIRETYLENKGWNIDLTQCNDIFWGPGCNIDPPNPSGVHDLRKI